MKDSAKSSTGKQAAERKLPAESTSRLPMNRYEAVIVASKEARRINDAMTKEQKEVSEKPIVSALRRLADDKLEVEKPRQKKG